MTETGRRGDRWLERERWANSQESRQTTRERGCQPVREEQTGRQADTRTGRAGREAGGSQDPGRQSERGRWERRDERRGGWAEGDVDRREKGAHEKIHRQSTLAGMTNVGTGAHLQLLAHGGGRARVPGPRGGGAEAGRLRRTRCAGVAHIHVGTLLPDTRRGAGERREPGTREKRQTHGGRARKIEVNRNKTEVESHLEVTEPESLEGGPGVSVSEEIKSPIQRSPATKRGRYPDGLAQRDQRRKRTEPYRGGIGGRLGAGPTQKAAGRLPKAGLRKRQSSWLGQVHQCVRMGGWCINKEFSSLLSKAGTGFPVIPTFCLLPTYTSRLRCS